jgi:uncharacterized glyoxalase superfamily protein PhnB
VEITMTASFKPSGYSTVSPYLIVSGASGTIDFLKRVFDATELRRFTHGAEQIAHAEVKIGDSVIMLADATEGWAAIPSHVHIYVSDVNETYRKALEAGAESVQEPVQKDDPDRRGGVKDAGGTTWWIATPTE